MHKYVKISDGIGYIDNYPDAHDFQRVNFTKIDEVRIYKEQAGKIKTVHYKYGDIFETVTEDSVN